MTPEFVPERLGNEWRNPSDSKAGNETMIDSGNSRVLAVSMTARTDVLQQLTLELNRRSSSPTGQRALRRFGSAGIDTDHATSLEELVRHCHETTTTRDPRHRELLEGLLELAPTDSDAALCALVALRPALYWVTRRVYAAASEEDVAEVVAFAWEAICWPAPRNSSRARMVVLGARTRARTAERQRRTKASLEDLSDEAISPTPSADPAERDEPMLARAVQARVVSHEDAEVIALTRGVGIPIKVLARDYDVSAKTLRRRRDRAEASLRRGLMSDLRSR
jgi:hypothetical protein